MDSLDIVDDGADVSTGGGVGGDGPITKAKVLSDVRFVHLGAHALRQVLNEVVAFREDAFGQLRRFAPYAVLVVGDCELHHLGVDSHKLQVDGVQGELVVDALKLVPHLIIEEPGQHLDVSDLVLGVQLIDDDHSAEAVLGLVGKLAILAVLVRAAHGLLTGGGQAGEALLVEIVGLLAHEGLGDVFHANGKTVGLTLLDLPAREVAGLDARIV